MSYRTGEESMRRNMRGEMTECGTQAQDENNLNAEAVKSRGQRGAPFNRSTDSYCTPSDRLPLLAIQICCTTFE